MLPISTLCGPCFGLTVLEDECAVPCGAERLVSQCKKLQDPEQAAPKHTCGWRQVHNVSGVVGGNSPKTGPTNEVNWTCHLPVCDKALL
jgi:hypothetical protein